MKATKILLLAGVLLLAGLVTNAAAQLAQTSKDLARSAVKLANIKTAPGAGVMADAAPVPVVKLTPATPTSPEPPKNEGPRRDPFVNPIVKLTDGKQPNCSTGKRCLMIGQLTLRGIIVSDEGMLAIVENAATRTYFLRINDPLFDGVVARISRDSITFRETVADSLGRPIGTREVVKKIVAPAA